MNSWQHPFVDLFRQYQVFEIAIQSGKGSVSVLQDQSVGRKVIKLSGTISSNNTVIIPDATQNIKSLGLTGRYIYFQFVPVRGRYFVAHFDLSIRDRDIPLRLTVSNMYEVYKVSQNQLQIPYPKNSEKWTVLILDIVYFLGNFGLLPHSLYKTFEGIHELKAIQLCSTMNVRGVYTSDNLYDWETMPKQMLFKLSKGAKYSEEYQIAYWNTQEKQPQLKKEPLKEVASNLIENLSKVGKPLAPQQLPEQLVSTGKPQQLDELVKKRPGDQSIYNKSIESPEHPLQPYPIQQLSKIIGFTVHNCPDIKWGRQSHTQRQVIYAAGSILVQNDIDTKEQKFFLGHSQPIACLDISKDGAWIVSGQQGRASVIRIWDYNRIECLSAFATPYSEIVNVAFSADRKLMVSVGRDDHNREVIIVWGLEQIEATRKPILIAKQSSPQNVLTIKFSPMDDSRIISCGHENIRFWRIKKAHLPGASVVLNHHARNTTFLVFDFEYGFDDPMRDKVQRVFFGAKTGALFQVNYKTQVLEAVYKVHNEPISAIAVSAGFCVTGSRDQFLRVWPLDFSEFYIEAKHEGVVSSLDVSLDGLQVVCGTSTGGLGVLDISNHNYRTVIRSHKGAITQIELHNFSGMLLSLSEDCTIRLWELDQQDQVYEFTFPLEDRCTCISGHPQGMYFAAGFKSGVIRVFDIENTSILFENKYHDCEIQHLAYNPSGTLLIASDQKSQYRLYDAQRQYQPIKTLDQFFPSQNNYSAFSIDCFMLATIGDSGTHANLWDGVSFQLLVKIFTPNSTIKLLKWASNNVELLVGCQEGKVKVYGIERKPDVVSAYFLREQSFMHRQLTDFIPSDNLKYLFSVGRDSFLKVWDYEFTLKGPGSNQVFNGHQSQINSVVVAKNGQFVVTAGGEEGIFVWEFQGYTGKNERNLNFSNFQAIQSMQLQKLENDQQQEEEEVDEKLDNVIDEQEELDPQYSDQVDQPQQLDKSPITVQSQQRQLQLNEQLPASNNMKTPSFQPRRMPQSFTYESHDFTRFSSRSTARRKQPVNYSKQKTPFKQFDPPAEEFKLLPSLPAMMISYNTNGHQNIVWNYAQGWFAYATQNYVIIEQLGKQRSQQILQFPYNITILQLCKKQKYLLIAGTTASGAPISVYTTENGVFAEYKTLNFHTKGVQQMEFTEDGKYLVSVGSGKECTVAIWDFNNFKFLASSYTLDKINDIKISRYSFSKERIFEFATVGRDQIYFWAYTKEEKLEYYDVFIPRNEVTNELEEITAFDYLYFSKSSQNQRADRLSESDKSVAVGSAIGTLTSEGGGNAGEVGSKASVGSKKSHQPQQPTLSSQQQAQDPLNDIVQIIIIGLLNGEIQLLKYGEFKVIYKKQISAGEINYIVASQAAGKLVISSSDNAMHQIDLNSFSTSQSFLESGLPLVKMNLPSMVCSQVFEPLFQQAILGLYNGSIYMLDGDKLFILAAGNNCNAQSAKQLDENLLMTTHQGGVVKIWNVQSAELLSECFFDQEVTATIFDGQQLICFTEKEQLKHIQMNCLDKYESYSMEKSNTKEVKIVTSCFGLFESIPIKLLLSSDGDLYMMEQLYKNSEFVMRLNKTLELKNGDQLVQLMEKKLVFLVEKNTGVVQTFLIDYNPDREVQQYNYIKQFTLGFTLYDVADFKEAPHGSLDDSQQINETRALYQYTNFTTRIAPAKHFDGVYFVAIDSLQYYFARNYHKKQNVLQVALTDFPLCIELQEQNSNLRLFLGSQSQIDVIDPNEFEERQLINNHLAGPVAFIFLLKKLKLLITISSSGGMCFYKQ